MRNPYASPLAVLGVSQATYDAAKSQLIAWLTARSNQADIPEATIRALHPALADERVWVTLASDIGLLP